MSFSRNIIAGKMIRLQQYVLSCHHEAFVWPVHENIPLRASYGYIVCVLSIQNVVLLSLIDPSTLSCSACGIKKDASFGLDTSFSSPHELVC